MNIDEKHENLQLLASRHRQSSSRYEYSSSAAMPSPTGRGGPTLGGDGIRPCSARKSTSRHRLRCQLLTTCTLRSYSSNSPERILVMQERISKIHSLLVGHQHSAGYQTPLPEYSGKHVWSTGRISVIKDEVDLPLVVASKRPASQYGRTQTLGDLCNRQECREVESRSHVQETKH